MKFQSLFSMKNKKEVSLVSDYWISLKSGTGKMKKIRH